MSAAVASGKATIHHITEARVSYRAADVPRCPDELLASDLPDWCKLVWLAVWKVQGSNPDAWAKAEHYAEVANKSVSQTRNALSHLRKTGWLEETGKEGNTPRLRCLIGSLKASPPVTESVTTSDASGGKRHQGEHSTSPPVTEGVTTSDAPYIRIESGQGIRSGNPSSEQQQQQGDGPEDLGEAEPERQRYPYHEGGAKLLVSRGVFPSVAAEIVTEHPPDRVLKEIERLRRLEKLGQVKDAGGLLVKYIRGEDKPLPGWPVNGAGGAGEAEVQR